MGKKQFEILNRSEELSALMDEDEIVYILYVYKNHLYRLEDGRITRADEDDRRYYERRNK